MPTFSWKLIIFHIIIWSFLQCLATSGSLEYLLGACSAPGKFQNNIEQVLTGVKGIVQFLDDTIVTRHEEHLQNLEVL